MENALTETQTIVAPKAGSHVILLVEDNLDDILLTKRAIKKANLSVSLHIVEDGDMAVEYLAGTGSFADRDTYPLPHLVLLDLKLPKRSGHEVLRWIRAQPRFVTMPVIVLTSSVEEEDIQNAYQGGVNSYLQKPVAFQMLVQRLSALGIYWLENNITSPRSGAYHN